MDVQKTSRLHILHIDDDEEEFLIIQDMLRHAQSYTVELEWASSFRQGKEKLHSNHYQAVLVDYDLGGDTGLDLIGELARCGYTAPLILLTGRGTQEVDVEAMRAGATMYLAKNEINPQLLERSIRYAIERKGAEQALWDREQRLTIALEAAQLGAWTYHFADHTLEMDARTMRLYGADEPVQSHDEIVQSRLDPADVPAMWAALTAAADPGGAGRYQAEYRVRQPDGGVRWLQAWGIAEFAGEGEERTAVRLIGASRDVTWEKEAQLALEKSNAALQTHQASLRESEARFRDLANNISQLAWMADESGWIFWYNQRWLDYTGESLEETQGWGWRKVHHPDHVDRVVEKITRCFASGEHWEDTFPLRAKDGSYRWFLSRAIPIKDPSGRVIRWFGTNTDVTDQLQLQEEYRSQGELLERLVQSAPAAIAFLHGPRHIYTLVNAEYERIGRGKGQLIGRALVDVWPELSENILPQMDSVYQTGQPLSMVDAPLEVVRDGVPETNYFTYTFTPIYRADHTVEGVMILGIETTTAVQDRLKAETQTARLEAILQALPVGAWIADPAGRILGKNRQADQIWAGDVPLSDTIAQYSEYRMWNCATGERVTEDQYPLVRALQSDGAVEPTEFTIERFDGTPGTVLISASPIHDAAGALAGGVAICVDISERKRAEELARASDQRLRETVESITDGFLAIDRNWVYTYVNETGARLIGSRVEDMVGRCVWDLNPHARDTLFYREYHRAVETQTPVHFEEFYPEPLNQWLECYCYPNADGLTVYFRDVSERKRAEVTLRNQDKALRESETRYRLATRATNDAIWDWDFVTDSIQWNEALTEKLGYSVAEQRSSGDWWKAHIHPQDRERVVQGIQAVIDGAQEVWSAEYRFLKADGSAADVSDRGWVIRDERGRPLRMVGAMRDRTQEHMAQQALRESEEKFRRLADAMPQLVWTATPDGTMDYFNQRYQQYDGIVQVDNGRWEWGLVVHPDDEPLVVAAWTEAVRTGSLYQKEFRVRMADGAYRWHLARAVPERGAEGRVVKWFGTTTDIHALKEAQEALAAYTEKLQRSNEELEQFAFMASHDLQEPLRKIQFFSSSLGRKLNGDLPEEAAEYLVRMNDSARRMQAMIDGLLNLARVNTRGSPFGPVDLNRVAREVIVDLETQVENTRGQVRLEPLPVVWGDQLQLRQVLHNLIGNALKYHREGIPPVVRLWAEPAGVEGERAALIVVEDNGLGIEDSAVEHIFQPFVRLHGRSYEGSGMGLAICRKIVERHGGQIAAAGRPGEGSRFTVRLPLPE